MTASTAGALERLDALAVEAGVELRADAPLAPLTTLRVGGPADRLAAPSSIDELVAMLRMADEVAMECMSIRSACPAISHVTSGRMWLQEWGRRALTV